MSQVISYLCQVISYLCVLLHVSPRDSHLCTQYQTLHIVVILNLLCLVVGPASDTSFKLYHLMQLELDLPSGQILGLFIRIIRKFVQLFNSLEEGVASETLVTPSANIDLQPVHQSVEQELVGVLLELDVMCVLCLHVHMCMCVWCRRRQQMTSREHKRRKELNLRLWIYLRKCVGV